MSGSDKRLFVAVPIPGEARGAVAGALARVDARGISWVGSGNYHLTVKFLGGVPEERIPVLAETLARAADGVAPFFLSLRGVGAFPSWRAARVVWVGVEGDLDVFRRLAGRVDRLCGEIGFPREGREASPHLTLGRRRDPVRDTGLRQAFGPMDTFFHGPFAVPEVHLMESRLLPGGAAYAILRTFTLRGE